MTSKRPGLRFLLAASLWLPIGIMLLIAVRFGPDMPDMHAVVSLYPTVPAGLFLAFGCWFVHRVGYRWFAWILFAILFLPSVQYATIGGLLGAPGILLAAFVVSLPSWIVLGILLLTRKLWKRAGRVRSSSRREGR